MKSFGQYLKEGHDYESKIRNLLALASRPGTAAEGITAREQAERLAKLHGIDISSLGPAIAPKPVAPPTPPPPDPFYTLLRQYGWQRERTPAGRVIYTSRGMNHSGHQIEVTPEGWNHAICGNVRYTGSTPRDLYHHLMFHVM
jgi:hypothetical protein